MNNSEYKENKLDTTQFTGFNKHTLAFFKALKKNNDKVWFRQNKKDFDAHVITPAKAFVASMGEYLQELAPNIIAIPKTDRSIFRIYRDTRFGPDKSPYKTHLGIYFWEGFRPKMECPGFYFHLEPPHLMLGVGWYIFPKNTLERYRNALVHPESGEEFSRILQAISQYKNYTMGGKHYKRIPSGFDAAHTNAEYLLYSGLYAGTESNIPDEFFSQDLLDYCFQKFKPLTDLHRWLVTMDSRGFGL